MEHELVVNKYHTSVVGTEDQTMNLNDSSYNNKVSEGLVTFIPKYRKRTMKTPDFIRNLLERTDTVHEILPTGCKFFKSFGDRKLVVVEEPPRIRTINVDIGIEPIIEKLRLTGKLKKYGYEDYFSKPPHSFQLSFPYVVYVIVTNKKNRFCYMYPFFRMHPITSLADYLCYAPLYNIPTSQRMCLGTVKETGSLYETSESAIENFWMNVFCQDYTNNVELYQKSIQHEVHDYLTWMYFTKNDPMFIYNIKWIPYSKNLFKLVEEIEAGETNSSSSNSTSFNSLYSALMNGVSKDIHHKEHATNLTLSCEINGSFITVGDELFFEGKKYYLYSLTSTDGERLHNVELESEDGSIIEVEFKKFKAGFNSIYIPSVLSEATVNGIVIKPNDIICYDVDGYKTYKKIISLRMAQDGCIEANIGTDHYLLENLNFTILDTKFITINGDSLDKDKTYWLLKPSGSYGLGLNLLELKYDDITINSSGNVILKFKNKSGSQTSINYNKLKNKEGGQFVENADVIKNIPVVYYFDRFFTNANLDESYRFGIIKGSGIVLHEDMELNRHSWDKSRLSITGMLNIILLDNETRLYIPGISVDIDFKVGDPIVFANWTVPEEMLMVATVTGFTVKDEVLYMEANTAGDKKVFSIPMIDFYYGRINVGVARKVFSQCGEWRSGDKIQPNVVGITNFPKKSINTIIGFINDGDTKYPLALCSNLCTLWMNHDTISKFNRIPFKTPKWLKVENDPIDLSKIKWQCGDLYKSSGPTRARGGINILHHKYGSSHTLSYCYLSGSANIEYGMSISRPHLDSEKSRHGILMPRVSNMELNTTSKAVPTLFGGFIETPNVNTHFKCVQFKEGF